MRESNGIVTILKWKKMATITIRVKPQWTAVTSHSPCTHLDHLVPWERDGLQSADILEDGWGTKDIDATKYTTPSYCRNYHILHTPSTHHAHTPCTHTSCALNRYRTQSLLSWNQYLVQFFLPSFNIA